MRTLSLVLTTTLLLMGGVLAGCGGDGDASSSGGSDAAATTSASSGGSGSAEQTVTIKPKGNQMKFQQTEFTVSPGATVKLVFENTATSPSMQHNVVVLSKAPKEANFRKIGQAGMQAGSANEYVPKDMGDLVLAHTAMSKPGETVSVTFTAPSETGDYGYVCTFPGHWATMQGTMHVKG